METAVKLELMNCYEGKQWAEVLPYSRDVHDEPDAQAGLYLQFKEGGYTVYSLTPTEAEKLGKILIEQAQVVKKEWGIE